MSVKINTRVNKTSIRHRNKNDKLKSNIGNLKPMSLQKKYMYYLHILHKTKNTIRKVVRNKTCTAMFITALVIFNVYRH